MKEQGLRFNDGKLRYDLLEPYAVEQLAKIFTMGAKKYAPNNWLKGMPWMDVIASLERHLAEFKKGVDFDEESKLLHMAHVAWNAMAIVSYYKHRPEFDNRRLPYLNRPKIGLDIDDVCADFLGGYCEKFGVEECKHWYSHYKTGEHLNEAIQDDKFYMSLKPKFKGEDIPFEPHCYITSRSIPVEWTERWLQDNGFPTKKVYTIPFGTSKVEIAKQSGIDIMLDDRFENFIELNNAGICTFLVTAPHNYKYNVGYKRVEDVIDFSKRFL